LVTSAGRGIGREIALHQAQGGAKVAVLARTAREIDETASLITGAGGTAIAIPVDLVDRLVTLLVDAEKRLESVLLTKKPNWRACQKAVGRPRMYQGVKISTRNETWP
jgi:NAD(P)-dependent dehydrogenase (short-subunit alcohol dehydrogenase family)